MTNEGNPLKDSNPYSSNMTSHPGGYNPEAHSYKEVQKQVQGNGVPVMTSINNVQRRQLQRQIISLYPDILNRNEAEQVRT